MQNSFNHHTTTINCRSPRCTVTKVEEDSFLLHHQYNITAASVMNSTTLLAEALHRGQRNTRAEHILPRGSHCFVIRKYAFRWFAKTNSVMRCWKRLTCYLQNILNLKLGRLRVYPSDICINSKRCGRSKARPDHQRRRID